MKLLNEFVTRKLVTSFFNALLITSLQWGCIGRLNTESTHYLRNPASPLKTEMSLPSRSYLAAVKNSEK